MRPEICRICLTNSGTISIFHSEEGVQYSTKIMQCVSLVSIEVDDGFPNSICSDCVSELSVSYAFYEKCTASDRVLRNLELSKDLLTIVDYNIAQSVKLESSSDGVKIESCSDGVKIESCSDEVKIESCSDDPENCYDENLFYELKESETSCENVKQKKHKKICKSGANRAKAAPIQCTICGLLVASPSAMKIHIRSHTGEKPFSCPFCDMSYPSNGRLKRHIDTYHTKRERKFTCETCGKSFFRKNDIITHMRCHTGEKPYSCPFCPKRFNQITSIIRHKRTHSGEKPYVCPICDRRFVDNSILKKHLSVHSNEKKYACHLCNKSMKSRTSLHTHMKLHSNEKTNICSFCGTSCSTKGNLKIHMQRVHSEKSGQCNVCLKTFSDLEVHMRKHTGEKPFICDVCSKAFSTKRSLTHHVLFKHENVKKFKCSIGECMRTFPTGTMLEFHLLKHHTNHTPYICQHCSRGFYRTSDLSRHLRVSHLDVPLKITGMTLHLPPKIE